MQSQSFNIMQRRKKVPLGIYNHSSDVGDKIEEIDVSIYQL